jgi:hypothetical protein
MHFHTKTIHSKSYGSEEHPLPVSALSAVGYRGQHARSLAERGWRMVLSVLYTVCTVCIHLYLHICSQCTHFNVHLRTWETLTHVFTTVYMHVQIPILHVRLRVRMCRVVTYSFAERRGDRGLCPRAPRGHGDNKTGDWAQS